MRSGCTDPLARPAMSPWQRERERGTIQPLATRRTRSAYAPRTKVGTALSRATWGDAGAMLAVAVVFGLGAML